MNTTLSIIGIPYDEQSSFLKGCVNGPEAIRKAFACESSNTFCEAGFDINGHPAINDEGDLTLGTGKTARDSITNAICEIVGADRKVLSLGGDHAITWPILQGISSKHPQIDVLHLDAHPDLYDELNGNRFSHATPMTRALEEGLIRRLVQVGIRTMNKPQQEQADRFGVEVISMNRWNPQTKMELAGPVYLSIDLDVLDPAFAPGVSHHEPGGMTTRELLGIIQRLDVDVIGADIVELNPDRDLHAVTSMAAAKVMKEVLAVMLR